MARKKQGGIGETIRTVVWALGIALVIRTVAFEPFKIPSPSMVPTLLIGDYLFVSKYSYGYSRHSLPFSMPLIPGRILFSEPERGDVIVFKYPGDNKTDYIKRLIGLPGDIVQVKGGRLYINDAMVEREDAGDYVYQDQSGSVVRLKKYVETLPGGVRHDILEESDNWRGGGWSPDDTPPFRVPEGHYFMMGDNRDHSADSRASVGFVPAVNLVGRAEALFFSLNPQQAPWSSGGLRFDRFFNGID